MQNYLALMDKILKHGEKRPDRTGTGTYSLFGESLRFDLDEGFPLLTTKKVHFHSIKVELLWFLMATDDPTFLHENNCTIWDEWIIKDGPDKGKLPNTYGMMWRKWKTGNTCDLCGGAKTVNPSYEFGAEQLGDGPMPCPKCDATGLEHVDQIANVIAGIKKDPMGRRHIVSAWNPPLVNNTALPWCHAFFQFYVNERVSRSGKIHRSLSCHLYQRSADYFLGVPFNIASYALLTHMIAAQTEMDVGQLIITFGDVHIYQNHVEQVVEQMRRKPRPLPQLLLADADNIDDYKVESITVEGYDSWPLIKAPVAV